MSTGPDFPAMPRPSATCPDMQYLVRLQRAASTLALQARHTRAVAAGMHRSRLHGRGVEFDEVRPYQSGDEVRNMDWRVTARTGKPHIKLFREERERPVFLMLDFRPAMFFATQGALKALLATECASLLAWTVLQGGDRLGGLVFDGQNTGGLQQLIRPARGQRNVLRFIGNTVNHPCWDTPTNLCRESLFESLQRGMRWVHTGGLLVVISDARGLDDACEALLRQCLQHRDVIFVWLYDSFEAVLPHAGLLPVTDGVHQRLLPTENPDVRQSSRQVFARRRDKLVALQKFPGFILIECATTDDPWRMLHNRLRK